MLSTCGGGVIVLHDLACQEVADVRQFQPYRSLHAAGLSGCRSVITQSC